MTRTSTLTAAESRTATHCEVTMTTAQRKESREHLPAAAFAPSAAEDAVLGILLCDGSRLAEVEQLQPDDFWHAKHRVVFSAMRSLIDRGIIPDLVTITDELRARGDLDKIGGAAWLSLLTDGPFAFCLLQDYAGTVREAAAARRLKAKLLESASQISPDTPLTQLVAEITQSVDVTADDQWVVNPFSETYTEIESAQNGQRSSRLYCGSDMLDKYAPPSDALVVIAGRPAMGKSSLSISLAMRYIRAGLGVLYLSIEMSAQDIIRRMISQRTGIPYRHMRERNGIAREQWDHLAAAMGWLQQVADDGRLTIAAGPMTDADVISMVRRHRAMDVVIIDHLQLVKIHQRKDERWDLSLGRFTGDLALASKTHQLTTILLSQLNRGVENRADNRPRMSDLRDSGRIEENADCVWLLYRPGYYSRTAPPGDIEIEIHKNRDGPSGVIHMTMDMPTGALKEGSHDHPSSRSR